MRHKKSGLQIPQPPPPSYSHSKTPCQKPILHPPPDYDEQLLPFKKNHPSKDLMNPHHHRNTNTSLSCCSSSEPLLATKAIALKLLLNLGHGKKLFWMKAPSRLFILLSLPSIYYFSLNHRQSLYLYILFLMTLCVLILSFLNLPSILAPVLNIGSNASKTRPPVVWSIGSKNRTQESTISGFLVKVYSNGDVYEGEFYKGKCSGSGVYYYNMNGRYEGDWVDQKYDGYGVETWAKGSRYRGQYRQGLRHGYGVYRFYTGDMYAGEWIKGQCHGHGVHTCEDGSKYFGVFKGGVKHGLGHYHFRNGDMYGGEYFADRMHGFGVYHFANGHRYEGGWHEGRRQGFGMYTFRNGETQSGHWEDAVLSISTPQDNAKVVKAIQEARRICKNAVGAANVEVKVKRAVAAANRAANAARVAAVKAVQSRVHRQHA
ncbi:MORN repeat-containing protein 1-like [Cynara cardunculus var. scolymus]|uniref:MORN motif-containing protein n=1 Tax=Cynara cardunculus var. scolymus TaxID=59895 RepID=A0A118JSJ4_CYNCS|nr:MORN repeat-containing protein 1-like [Cynara cardunculus var. scolymus]KVH88612.1 MORN motif-containing protein [Cynara cardunculus var. scolymus]